MAAKKGKKPAPIPAKPKAQTKDRRWLMIVICLVLASIAFIPVLTGDFVNWDDPDYVTKNEMIKSPGNIKQFFTVTVQGNYHPLTMITLALNYALSKMNASSYHVLNLLLHLVNVMLVFFFIYKISGKKQWMAFIVAVLFGVHPLHVESVAWVSERKDVLYSMFFLLGMISYLKYIEEKKTTNLLIVALFFILSLLSKPAAVIFPVVLTIIDLYYKRLKNFTVILEKIPFFLISLAFGILSVKTQSETGAVSLAGMFPVHFRFFFGFYGIMMYIFKTVYPVGLCTFYPFPAINSALPWVYYLAFGFTIALITAMFWSFKKYRLIGFGILFYIVNLLLVLQFWPVGSAVIADRYSYMPLVGIFIIPAFFIQKAADKNKGKLPLIYLLPMMIVLAALVFLTIRQSATWRNSAALWDHAISVEPCSRAYTFRGQIYKREKNYDKAIEMYTKSIQLNKVETEALVNRGNIYFNTGKYDLAITDYTTALKIDSTEPRALENRGSAYAQTGRYEEALKDMNAVIRIEPQSKSAYSNRALLFQTLNRHNEAIDDYFSHIRYNPTAQLDDIWNALGTSYQVLNEHLKAIECFSKAIQINNAGVYHANRSLSYYSAGNIKLAGMDAEIALKAGVKLNPEYLNKLK